MQPSTTYKPFVYPQLVEKAIEHDAIHWGEWEASLQRDVNQWRDGTVTDAERDHITQILRLFTQTDQVVGGTYVDYFLRHIKNNEARMMLLSFAHRETIHMRAYALLNDTLGLPEKEYSAFQQIEEMAEKLDFMVPPQCDDPAPADIALYHARSVINEGLSLFSAFAQLLAYQLPENGGKMLGMGEIVEWSVRDETLHVMGHIELFRILTTEGTFVNDLFKKIIYEMFRQAVALEDRVIDITMAKGGPKNLTAEDLKTYIRFLADRRLTQLGLKPNWEIEHNPLPWLDHIVGGAMDKNFFEGRVTDYNSNGLVGDWGWE